MFSFFPHVALIASWIIPTVSAIPTLSIQGAKFFVDGQQFFIKGINHVVLVTSTRS